MAPKVLEVSLRTSEDLKDFLKDLGGGCLSCAGEDRVRRRIEDLNDGGAYVIVGGYYGAVMAEKTRRQVEDKVLEVEAALAVQNYLNVKRCRV